MSPGGEVREGYLALAGALPDPGGWLSPAELEVWPQAGSSAQAWLAGRWLAKSLLLQCPSWGGAHRHDLTILSHDGRGRRNRPRIYHQGQLLGWRLSLSHSRHFAYAALGPTCAPAFGVDVADQEEMSPAFSAAWFTPGERRGPHDPLHLWTAKEAAYKACQQGETFDPRLAEVEADRVHYRGHRCRVRWLCDRDTVRALAVVESPLGGGRRA